MPGPTSEILVELQRSGLIRPDQVEPLTLALAEDAPSTKPSVAQALVEKKVLTPYQAEQFVAGTADLCVVAGRYRIDEKLGEGGMGAVYRAHDTQLDRDVALKVLPARSLGDADAIIRFQREARALAKLSHPHIIQAFDSGEDKGRHFLVMEYVEGASLAAVLREQGAIPPTLAADFIHQAALGLQHAHEKGLIHRDLKPANLLVSRGRALAPVSAVTMGATRDYAPPSIASGVLKILDLGLARFLQDHVGDGQLTQEGMGVGTPDYMAPEQFRDALHADVRTDIYGLGCTLYQLIAGTVPFPGSSFSEKAQAHAKKEPIPLEERCPDVPFGLAFVVSKMMAKHPSDRFQTAAEVAEALAPYVAGASHSVLMLRQTMRFHAGQLTMKAPRNRRWLIDTGIGIAAALVVGLGFFAYQNWFGRGDGKPPDEPELGAKPASTEPPGTKPAEPKVVTIENGLTVAKDGTGQYTTIGEALENIKAGQTIRVLDGEVYKETLSIRSQSRHGDITIESPQRATLEIITKAGNGIVVSGVPGVTIRDLRMRISAAQVLAIQIKGPCSGLVLEGLEMDINPGGDYNGVAFYGCELPPDAPPMVVRNCIFRRPKIGIGVIAILEADYKTPLPCSRIVIRDNAITDPAGYGIILRGLMRQVQVAGNRIWGTTQWSALQADHIIEGSEAILIANNTVLECGPAFRLWDQTVNGKNVEFRNNLILGMSDSDMYFMLTDPNPQDSGGPGNGKLVTEKWQWSHNWREVKPPTGDGVGAKGWIPPSAGDVVSEQIPVQSRDPKSAEFLRPAKHSDLATKGAGGDLPSYVGAVAPDGGEQWNWQWTWDAQVNKLITVSKKKEDGGRFQTIGEAVKAVRPKMVIRVLDDAFYPETLLLDDRERQSGITLEAVQRAVFELQSPAKPALRIENVPGMRIRGFRFRTNDAFPSVDIAKERVTAFVEIRGSCPGLLLEALEMQSTKTATGVLVMNANGEEPIRIKRCDFDMACYGIVLTGSVVSPSKGVMVEDNHIRNAMKGITFEYFVADTLIAGNIIRNCQWTGLELRTLSHPSSGIRIVNNTFHGGQIGFRVWHDPPYPEFKKGQVAFCNNLMFGSNHGDMGYHRQEKPQTSGEFHDSQFLMDLWTFEYNARDRAGASANKLIPLSPKDREVKDSEIVSFSASSGDFLRPKPDSPLAKDGAGKDDPTLPIYVGAVPPKDVPAWNWQHTWDMRVGKLYTVSKKSENRGAFRTIGAALKAVRENGSTIRVLDAESYPEPLEIKDAGRLTGLTLDAPERATLELTAESEVLILIHNVPSVQIVGFRFKRTGGSVIATFIKATGKCPGLVLWNLDMLATDLIYAVMLDHVKVEIQQDPVQVRNCVVRGAKPKTPCEAVTWMGPQQMSEPPTIARGALILDNRFEDIHHGVVVRGAVADVFVAGNVCVRCDQTGLQLQDIMPGSGNILVANNSAIDCGSGLRIWDGEPYKKYEKGQVHVCNNVFARSVRMDVGFVLAPSGGGTKFSPGNAGELWKTWMIGQNYRDESGGVNLLIAPMADGDKKFNIDDVISKDDSKPDFLRPKPDSPLATEGAGKDDATLPKYVGAVPPKGVEPWDWEKTWKARMKKPEPGK